MDLNLTQGQFDEIFKRLGIAIRVRDWLDEFGRLRMIDDRNTYYGTGGFTTKFNDDAAQLSNVSLTGVVFDTDTDDQGRLYLKIIDNAGTYTIEIYNDAARTVLVADGTSVVNPDTITISPQAGYTIAGSIDLDYSGDDSDIYLEIRPDFKRIATDLFKVDQKDLEMLSDFLGYLTDAGTSIQTIIDVFDAFIEDTLIMDYIKLAIKSTKETSLTITESDDGGTISIVYEGVLKDLADAMADNTVPQTIRNYDPDSVAAVAADPDNVGSGTVAVTLKEHAEEGVVTLECTDETIGSETFEVKYNPTNKNLFSERTGTYEAVIKKDYKDNGIGIDSLIISRTITETGDGDSQLDEWVINGETEDNTDGGKLYVNYTTVGNIVDIYSDAARTVLVASGSGTGTIALTEQNGSGLSGSVKVTDAAADDTDIVLDLNVFKLEDKFQFDISRSVKINAGRFQRFLSRIYRYALPSDPTIGNETISDNFARRG